MNERLYNLESTAAQIPKAGLVVLRAARRAPLTSDGDWVYEVLLFKVVFVAGNDPHGTFSAQAHSSSPNVFTTWHAMPLPLQVALWQPVLACEWWYDFCDETVWAILISHAVLALVRIIVRRRP